MTKNIALTWQIGSNFGWGLYGMHIAIQLKIQGRAEPILLSRADAYSGDPMEREILEQVWRNGRGPVSRAQANRAHGARIGLKVPIISAYGNNGAWQFVYPYYDYQGTENHGIVFVENTNLHEKARDVFNGLDTLTAGSTWARDVLRDRGVPEVQACIQGIDPWVFHPLPKRDFYPDRFVIFSGGKLEYRKGQDIVMEAVRRFRERHPETLLVCLWDNPWVQGPFIRLFDRSPHFPGLLDHIDEKGIDWPGALTAAGIPGTATRVFKTLDNRVLPYVMRECDVALFPNRCEGGTNMMAMQAMACGVPAILSANTGHMDIIGEGACLPLTRQGKVEIDHPDIGTESWGESDIDEILDALERVYTDRAEAERIGTAGARFMARHDWATQVRELADIIGL